VYVDVSGVESRLDSLNTQVAAQSTVVRVSEQVAYSAANTLYQFAVVGVILVGLTIALLLVVH
jgi:hypothetical protein